MAEKFPGKKATYYSYKINKGNISHDRYLIQRYVSSFLFLACVDLPHYML